MLLLIRKFLTEKDGVNDFDSGPNFGEGDDLKRTPPLIICLDDMQNHDEVSWNLTIKVLRNIRKIFVVGIVRSEELETTPERADIVDQGIRNIAEIKDIVTDKLIMKRFEFPEIEKILKKLLEGRQPSDELTRFIIDRSEGIPLVSIDLIDNLLK